MKTSSKFKVRPIPSPAQAETTFYAAGLGEMGLGSEAIAKECGLSVGQVNYRLKTLLVNRRSYRAGESETFKAVLDLVFDSVDARVRRRAKKI